MKIVTWNMGHWGHSRNHEMAWRWLLEKLQPDVALLQECVPPSWVPERGTLFFERAYPTPARQRWGTAVFTTLKGRPARLPEVEAWLDGIRRQEVICSATRLSSWCVASEIDIPTSSPTLFISLHNPFYPIARTLLQGQDLSAIKLKLNKDVWLLDVLFYFLRQRLQMGQRLVIGGDFNYSRLLDEPKPRGNAEFFDRLQSEGFVSLHRLHHDRDEQTFFHPKRREHQLDYLYADSSFAAIVEDCRVIPYGQVEGFSDHAPLVAQVAET